MEDDRVAILEAQVAQAKLIAEEADKKYEEVSVQNNTLTRYFICMWLMAIEILEWNISSSRECLS